jgi:hypothetical protein
MPMNQLDVETPIGILQFYADAAEGDVGNVNLTYCEIEPNIPKGMSVDGCKAVLLRCIPNTSIKNFNFSCSWKELRETGYGNSGECLDAWEWELNGILVMVGTEDDECLGSRVKLKESTTSYYPITMNDNSIKVHIYEFPEGKELTLHYIISWNSIPEKVESSCWYAVDIPHDRVLKECN